jgi:pimeloyl-ACP methyl ester carboxylesterase
MGRNSRKKAATVVTSQAPCPSWLRPAFSTSAISNPGQRQHRTVALHGDVDGVTPPDGSAHHHRYFTAKYERRIVAGVGHNFPQEAPQEFAGAVLLLV